MALARMVGLAVTPRMPALHVTAQRAVPQVGARKIVEPGALPLELVQAMQIPQRWYLRVLVGWGADVFGPSQAKAALAGGRFPGGLPAGTLRESRRARS